MKWFKHDSDANMDAKLQEVLLDYGLEGYGLYWYCLEMIVNKIDVDNLTFELEHDCRIIARNTGATVQKVTEMMKRFVELGLFQDSSGVITCLKLAQRLDKSMTSNPKMREMIERAKCSHDSVMINPDLVMQDKKRREEKRIDKNRINSVLDDLFELYWSAGMKKVNKKKALSVFKRLASKEPDPKAFTDKLINDVTQRLAVNQLGFAEMHPTTYLNNERWNDEIRQQQPAASQQRTSVVSRVEQAVAQREAEIRSRNGASGAINPQAMDQAGAHVRPQAGEPIRGHATGHMGEVYEGDYTATNG